MEEGVREGECHPPSPGLPFFRRRQGPAGMEGEILYYFLAHCTRRRCAFHQNRAAHGCSDDGKLHKGAISEIAD